MTTRVLKRRFAWGPREKVWDVTRPSKPFHLLTRALHVLVLDRMAVVWLKDPLLWGLFKVVT